MFFNKKKKVPSEKVQQDPTEALIDQILVEFQDEDEAKRELEEKNKARKRRIRHTTTILTSLVVLIGIGLYAFVVSQTYHSVRLTNSYSFDSVAAGQYIHYFDGIVKYSREGISLLNMKGVEQWNHPCQMKTPRIDKQGDSLALYDLGGNNIVILNKDGYVGEVQTTLPIEKVKVSNQGIVATILNNDASPLIMCYDVVGKVLVEHKTATSTTGYPLDIAISPSGEILMVSYVYLEENDITTYIGYYHFGEAGKAEPDHRVAHDKYENTLMPISFFVNEDTSVIVGDRSFVIYQGEEKPKMLREVALSKEIKSVFYNHKNIGFVLKNEKGNSSELRLYSMAGSQILSVEIEGNYSHTKVQGNQIILYEGDRCLIYTNHGAKRYEGVLENEIYEIIPQFGINKYLVVNSNGFDEIQFVK